MNGFSRTCFILLACTVPVGVSLAQHEAGDKHEHAAIGQKAPDFELKSIDGKMHSLADFREKVVVLEWTNHQCPVVNRYVAKQKTMQQTFDKFKDKDVAWLAIDSSHFCEDKIEDIKEFVKDKGIHYPVLLDASGEVGHLYGARTTPHMFVIDKHGVLVYMGSMDDDQYGGSENARNYVAEAVEAALTDSTVPVSRTQSFGCSVKYKK